VVVDAEVNREQGRPLFGVNGEVCKKSCEKKKKGLDRADIVRDVGLPVTWLPVLNLTGYDVYRDLVG
jgi:hypothetical protein